MLMGVISHCRVVVANDSGALHLAAALGVRAVGIYGPTHERYSTPVTPHEDALNIVDSGFRRVFCRPCFLADCPIDHRCMKRIPTERVYEAVRRFLQETSRVTHAQGGVSRSRRDDDRGCRLPRSSRTPETVSLHDRRRAAAERRGLQDRRRDEPERCGQRRSYRGISRPRPTRICRSCSSRPERKVDGYYYCPHSPFASVERYRTDCDCRKPKPGMILAAARDHGIDLPRRSSLAIGGATSKWGSRRGRRPCWSRRGTAERKRRVAPAIFHPCPWSER